jgi:hypothetical protein
MDEVILRLDIHDSLSIKSDSWLEEMIKKEMLWILNGNSKTWAYQKRIYHEKYADGLLPNKL